MPDPPILQRSRRPPANPGNSLEMCQLRQRNSRCSGNPTQKPTKTFNVYENLERLPMP